MGKATLPGVFILIKSQKLRGSLLSIIFVGIVAAICFFALQQIKTETTNNIRNSLQIVLQTVRESHHIWISERTDNLVIKTNTPKHIALVEELLDLYNRQVPLIGSEALRLMREIIVPLLEKSKGKEFFLIAPDRKSIAATRNISIGATNPIQEQKEALLDKVFSGVVTFIPSIRSVGPLEFELGSTHSMAMFLAIPVIDNDGDVIAVFAIHIHSFSQLSRITQLGRLGETGETYAFNEGGILVTESRFDHQLRMANIISPGQQGARNVRIADPGGNILEGYRPDINPDKFPLTKMASSALQGADGYDISGYRDYRGVRVFGAWTWLDKYKIGITTEIDEAEALQPYYQTRNTFLAVVIATTFLAISMLYLLFRSQTEARIQLLQAHDSLEQRVQDRTQELEDAKDALASANEGLEKLAITDSLTGLFNRRHFFDQVNMEWQRCLRYKKPISIILLDIDYFKPFNDTYGHVIGDECLMKVASALDTDQFANRPGDAVARYGGEEFIVLLSDADSAYTCRVAELIRESVAQLRILHEGSLVTDISYVTVSLGYATENNLDLVKPKLLIKKADQALYQAKREGRNRAIEYSENSPGTVIKLKH